MHQKLSDQLITKKVQSTMLMTPTTIIIVTALMAMEGMAEVMEALTEDMAEDMA